MQVETKIQVIILCYISAMIIVPSDPSTYTFFIDTVGSVVSLTSIAFIISFYSTSVPPWHRTCIQGLSQLLMVCLGIVVIRAFVVSLMVNVLHDLTQRLLFEYPKLSCIMFSGRNTYVPTILSILMIEASRLGLLLFTMRFQSLNHERIVQVCVVLTVGITITDILLSSTLRYFNYCQNMRNFARISKFDLAPDVVPEENTLFGSPIPVISFTILAIEIVYQAIHNYGEFKTNKVNILPKANLEQKPSSLSRAVGTLGLAPPINLIAEESTRTRHLSFHLEVRKKAKFRRFSLDSLSGDYNIRNLTSPIPSLQVNRWTGRSIQNETSGVRNTPRHSAINVDTSAINVGSQKKPQRKAKCSSFTLVMLFIQSSFVVWTIMQNYKKQHQSSLIGNFFDVLVPTFFRFIKYCIGVYWIHESEKMSEFTIVKSKNIIKRFLSLSFLPMSVKDLANTLQ